MHVICVAAARPNFMKIKPVIDGLEKIDIKTSLVHTGQHYDASMSDIFFEELGIRTPDYYLGAGSGSHSEQTAKVLVEFERLVPSIPADAVLVVGDVNSTLACALVGAKSGLMVGHVEAGLRSRDWSMPEEVNRVVADRVSDLLLAPSEDAVLNLKAEGYREDQIHLVGNVMIDTMLVNRERARSRSVSNRFGMEPGGYGVVTLHRPSNVDNPTNLASLLDILDEVSRIVPLIFPVHPRTRRSIESAQLSTGSLVLADPLGYLDFLSLMSESSVILTDSGGIQEESTVLGIPCLTLRENTERPITITEGTNTLVGLDRSRIIEAASRAISGGVPVRRPALWDGRAGDRIAAVVSSALRGPRRHPTDLVSPTRQS